MANLWRSFLVGVATLAFSAVAHADPEPETGFGMPRDVSRYGHHIDWLIEITLVFTTILFVIMVAWMLWACIKHNHKHPAEYDHGSSKKSVRMALAISAVIFFVVDGNLWVDSSLDVNGIFWNHAMAESDRDAVRIEINAHQWVWDARYAGPDKEFNTQDDIVTMNDIRVPVDTPVLLQLASPDVIHSFYLPNLRLKQDAVPGMINRMWFEAVETGEFDIACAQHCGVHHYKMKGRLTVLSRRDYAAWAAEASTISARAFDARDETAHWGWAWQEL